MRTFDLRPLLTLLPLCATLACADDRGSTPALQAALDGLAASEVADNDYVGLAISVRVGDGRTFYADAGHIDPERSAPYDVATTEQVIGSVTKLYTAVLVMQLVESGAFALDDTLDRWFSFPSAGDITVRMLLDHTSGLGDYLEGMTLDQVGEAWTPDAIVARALAAEPFGAPPLAKAVYTNSGAALLAVIIEAVSGASWQDNVARHIASPLGLEHTYYAGEVDMAAGLVGGWMLTDDGWVDSLGLIDPSIGWGSGAMVTTSAELLRFTAALFDGELFQDPATLAAMLSFDTPIDPAHGGAEPATHVGLAVLRMEIDGVRLDGHVGHIEGFNAVAVHDPDSDALIVVTSNDDRAFVGYTALTVAQYLRGL